ncbi:MAG TPA: amidohydrolase [Phycisphaerales bacterium]|nr:amidohydrolase [Phycisphaerales bacterium]
MIETASLTDAVALELPELVAFRHDLHRHPELSYEEHRTSARVCEELEKLGIAYKAGLAKGTGVVAHLPATGGSGTGGRAVPAVRPHGSERRASAVALRADMDALPIAERSGRLYSSENPGVMHACGHDGHTAILLGAARVLSKLDHRPNPVTFIFQPAEEGGAGGERMCDEGCLLGDEGGGLGPPIGRIFGLHGWPNVPLGTVATRPGPLLAATDDFVVRVRGIGGHAAYPHLAADPIIAAAHIVTALQSIASRNVGPTDAVVVTVGRIAGGTVSNVIPSSVELVGTVRTLRVETRRLARERLFAIVEQTAAAFGCRAEIDWEDGYPVTSNDAGLTEHFFAVAREALGERRVSVVEHPSLGGEDFSYYGRHVPACFYMLGLLPPGQDPATTPKLHQAEFDFNDEAIPTGVELMCRLALAEL